MEHAPLRPIAARPPGRVDPAAAFAAVAAALPGLDERAGRARALVGLVGRPCLEVAMRLGLREEELARELAAARKALRRSVVALGGRGWC